MINLGINKYIVIPLALLTLVLSGCLYYTVNKIDKLIKENAIIEANNITLKAANINMSERVEDLSKNLNDLQKEKDIIQKEIDKRKNIFEEHSLKTLGDSKPKLIEKKMNDGIQKILEELEE